MSKKLYQWQKEAIAKVRGKNAIIIAPTGSGKTEVLKAWGLHDENCRVFITAPIKALSNERYRELKEEGYDVGIDTGDCKIDTEARIVCCTQEIYTNKYNHIHFAKVIIDEFHYINENRDRSLAYIQGIYRMPEDTQLLILSATIGNPQATKAYLERLHKNKFVLYQTDFRAAELIYPKDKRHAMVRYKNIQDALVFTYSAKNTKMIASRIAIGRTNNISADDLEKYAKEFGAERFCRLNYYILSCGVGIYYGSMLPKEKLFIETLFRNQILDVVVGTDALALGVNLPAETVIFSQTAKYYDGDLSVSAFMQEAGRAGRIGYFDKGYIRLLADNQFEAFERQNTYLNHFLELSNKARDNRAEDINIKVDLDWKNVFKIFGQIPDNCTHVTLSGFYSKHRKDEVQQFLQELNELQMHPDKRSVKDWSREISSTLRDLDSYIKSHLLEAEIYSEEVRRLETICANNAVLTYFQKCYFPEYDIETQMEYCRQFIQNGEIDLKNDIEYLKEQEKVYDLLQLKRWLNHLPKEYRKKVKGKELLDPAIAAIDDTILGIRSTAQAEDAE